MKKRIIVAFCMAAVLMFAQIGLAEERSITVATWGGRFLEAQTKAFFQPFEQKTGIKVKVMEIAGDVVAKVKAQVMQDIPEYDLVTGIGVQDQVYVLSKGGYILPINYRKLPNSKDIISQAKFKYGVGAYVLSNNIAYNKKFYPNGGPKNMKEFFEPKAFPGPRAIIGFSPTGYLESALIADGVPVKKLYPLDVDRAFRKLDQLKPSISLFWTSGAQQVQALKDEEVYCGMFWVGHALTAKEAGTPVELVWQDGHMIFDCWAIPKNARNLDLVYKFLNFCYEPQQEAIFSRIMRYGPVNQKTLNVLTPAERIQMNTYPENMKKMFFVNVPYWEQNYEKLSERFMQWLSKKN